MPELAGICQDNVEALVYTHSQLLSMNDSQLNCAPHFPGLDFRLDYIKLAFCVEDVVRKTAFSLSAKSKVGWVGRKAKVRV